MKSIRVGVVVLAGFILAACSSQHSNGDERTGSIGVDLRTNDGVVIDSVSYDLDTQAGAQVAEGSIPVPEDDSVISLGIESLAAGGYRLAFSAQATYLGTSIPCVSAPLAFSLAESQHLTLPTVSLICSVQVTTPDGSGGVTAGVEVVVETITVGNTQEVLSYGPRSVRGRTSGASCVYPPIALAIENRDPAITYEWSASPDGSFALNATGTNGTYTCRSSGVKALTLEAMRGSVSGSKTITVQCIPCTGRDICGDGIVSGPEQCDEQTPRCSQCIITPTCGDAVVDAPEVCDAALPTPPCDPFCGLGDPLAQCFSCIDADPVTGPVQAAYCDPEPRCTTVQTCVLESGCFLPLPAVCYCGPNIDNCRNALFVPTGPCREEIAAGVNVPQPTNGEALDFFFNFEHPTGVAMLILDEASRACTGPCFGSIVCGNGRVEPGEQCDEDSDRCVSCRIVPLCGDGTVDLPEQCEGSSARCQNCRIVPLCGDGTVDLPEQCEGSSARCQNCRIVPVCGDGIVDAGEQCDNESEYCVDCQLIPGCGNLVLELGEECDPGAPTEWCDAQCRFTNSSFPSCLSQCFAGNAELESVQVTYCDPHAACTAVEACVIETGCFLPIPAGCYCGSDIVGCREDPAFVPVGPCKDVIRAGLGLDNPSNATILDRFYDFNYPTGVAMLILDEASRQCPLCDF